MSRTITTATRNQAIAETNAPIFFVKLVLDSGTIGFHSRLGDVVFDGLTYTGAGDLGRISTVREDSDMSRPTLQTSLSGLNSALLSVVLSQYYQGRSATVYGGYVDLSTNALIADPMILYEGKIDSSVIQKLAGTMEISLTIENELADWERPRIRRYNNADQQSRYPGDTFFKFAEQAAYKTVYWGRSGV